MNGFTKLFASAVICALPLVAGAQTTTPMDKSSSGKVLAPDQPRSESERKATTENGQAPKYGQTDAGSADSMDKGDTSKARMTRKRAKKVDKSEQAATGDSPSYPAKTKDGRSTGDSTVKATPAGQ